MTKAAELAKMGEILTNSQIGGRRNIVINGAMQVAQRATSATGVGANNSVYPTVDRIKVVALNTAGRATMSQVADVHDGFANALKLECTTADTSIASNEIFVLQTGFEGQDLQQLKKGTSDAEKVTVSFYVKANANATYGVELEDGDNSRFNSQSFAVTTDWTRVTKTFIADTTGSLDDDNALSLNLNIWLHGGSDYSGGTFSSNTWHTTTNQRMVDSQTSFFDSTDRTFFITGLQMEVGSQATPFEHRSFGEEQRLCQRYAIVYSKNGQPNMGQRAIGTGASTNNSGAYQAFIFPQVTMRAIPTLTVGGSVSDYEILKYETGFVDLNSSISLYSASGRSLFVLAISSATAEAERGRDVIMRLEGDNSSLLFDSEL
jgi:hypothetical protein